MSDFRPKFADYDVVVSNYNGDRWPKETEKEFEAFVAGGGGFVTVHAANNSFPDWPEYNHMIGLGGWDGRTEKPARTSISTTRAKWSATIRPAPAAITARSTSFKSARATPSTPSSKACRPRGCTPRTSSTTPSAARPRDMHILATAYSDPENGGTGRHEPMLMTLDYGKGRVFHTVLGHADYSMNCVGFITTLNRGTEWAATGKVTIPVPKDFPTAEKSQSIK